jgi:hypothetical protein
MVDVHSLHMLTAMMAIFLIPCLILIVILMIPYWFIWKKAGFAPWLSLLMLIPMLNLIMLYVLAFSDWKVVPLAHLQQQQPLPPRV